MDKIYMIHENSWGNAFYLEEGEIKQGEERTGHGFYGPRPLTAGSFIERKNKENYVYFLIKEVEYTDNPRDMFTGLFQYIGGSKIQLSISKNGAKELTEFCLEKGYK